MKMHFVFTILEHEEFLIHALACILSTECRLLDISVMGLQQVYQSRCLGKAMKIIDDNRQPIIILSLGYCLQVDCLGYF